MHSHQQPQQRAMGGTKHASKPAVIQKLRPDIMNTKPKKDMLLERN
jgi:hypothetical protein